MKISKLIGAVAVISFSVAASLGLSACAPTLDPVITPVTMGVNELQGASVDLVVGQVLNINTNDLAVDSYTGEVDDAKVARFELGKVEGGATFNPGVTALAVGKTTVVMTNSNGGIQPLTFTVKVSDK